MKNLAIIAAVAAGLFATAAPLHAQNTQNAQDPAATAPAPPKTDRATRTTVRRSTKRTTTGQTTQATISARNNARLNARLRANERASVVTTNRAPRLDGGVVRAVRSDSPLQAVNPFAPAEYGSGEQVARHEPDDPFQRPQGLRLLVVEF